MNWQSKVIQMHRKLVPFSWTIEDTRFLTLALSGEVGELANLLKKEWRGDTMGPDFYDKLDSELADIRIYLELLAHCYGINIDQACERKVDILLNERWPHLKEEIE